MAVDAQYTKNFFRRVTVFAHGWRYSNWSASRTEELFGYATDTTGAVDAFVYDGKPYGVPVALTPDAFLPKTCM